MPRAGTKKPKPEEAGLVKLAVEVSAEAKNPRGRPTDYDPAYVELAKNYCQLGATDVQLAEMFDIHLSTLHRWRLLYPDFSEATKTGKDIADSRMESSLYQRGLGYTIEEQQAIKIKVGDGVEDVKIVPVQRHVPADTTAMIFWLKNRRKDQWRDVHKHEVGQPGDFDHMSADELRESIARDIADLGSEDAASALALREGKPAGSGRPN